MSCFWRHDWSLWKDRSGGIILDSREVERAIACGFKREDVTSAQQWVVQERRCKNCDRLELREVWP